MMNPASDATDRATGTPQQGAGICIVVACPHCGQRGLVRWDQLPHAVHCSKCNTRFWLDTQGKLRSERKSKRIRFCCPRCMHRDLFPPEIVAAGVRCPGCGDRFYLGSDEDFLSLAELKRTESTRQKTRQQAGDVASRNRSQLKSPNRLIRYAGFGFVVFCLLLSAGVPLWFAGTSASESLEAAAVGFTLDCISGRLDEAQLRVRDGNLDEFKRWKAMAFAELMHPESSTRGEVDIDVIDVREQGQSQRIRLVLHRRSQGRRLQTQFWMRTDEGWRFDAQRTLQANHST